MAADLRPPDMNDMNDRNWLLYGANGYTGRLIARLAVERGARPVLAGRSREKIQPLAEQLGCPWRAFALDDAGEVRRSLEGVAAVLHCAGPFCDTARPMVEACLASGTHYLDITGEYDVIEWAHQQHQRARDAGIVIMPAVGMDVVPSDCLGALLAAAVPGADRLVLAFAGDVTVSPGTAHTVWRHIAAGGRVRRDGRLVHVPAAGDFQDIDFPGGRRSAMLIPWGDIASAYYTTGIPNIEVRFGLPPRQARLARRGRWLLPLAGLAPVQALGRWWIRRHVPGPSESELAEGRTEFWGRASNPQGGSGEATLTTPHGYRLTADSACVIVEHVQAGGVPAGFHTPAGALGGDFIHQLHGIELRWVRRPETPPAGSQPHPP